MSPASSLLATGLWCSSEPCRLERDQVEIRLFEPSLRYVAPDGDNHGGPFTHGGWVGVLPLWPFDRPEPGDLTLLVPAGLKMRLSYPAAYPMVPPEIFPVRPEPTIAQRTQAAWHVLPGGGLCLFQSDGAWLPEASIVDLLIKAAGWNIEYALMQAGVIDKMTTCGIANDQSLDGLVATALKLGQPSDG